MNVGQIFEQEIIVTKDMLASSLGSGAVDVFATPYMIAKMEETSSLCVANDIGEGNVTVGVVVNITHLSATPLGMKVTFKAELTEVTPKMLTFKVEAFDEVCKIGEGVHTRAIVFKEKFEAKTNAKK
ncbi:MAG: hotdog domain-containing protein [Clostridia bacterium]